MLKLKQGIDRILSSLYGIQLFDKTHCPEDAKNQEEKTSNVLKPREGSEEHLEKGSENEIIRGAIYARWYEKSIQSEEEQKKEREPGPRPQQMWKKLSPGSEELETLKEKFQFMTKEQVSILNSCEEKLAALKNTWPEIENKYIALTDSSVTSAEPTFCYSLGDNASDCQVDLISTVDKAAATALVTKLKKDLPRKTKDASIQTQPIMAFPQKAAPINVQLRKEAGTDKIKSLPSKRLLSRYKQAPRNKELDRNRAVEIIEKNLKDQEENITNLQNELAELDKEFEDSYDHDQPQSCELSALKAENERMRKILKASKRLCLKEMMETKKEMMRVLEEIVNFPYEIPHKVLRRILMLSD